MKQFELPRQVAAISSPFLIVCDGYSDVRLIDELLQLHKMTNCSVGCKSDDFGKDLAGYLKAIKGVLDIKGIMLQGVCLIVDADDSQDKAFKQACNALKEADFPVPTKPFRIEGLNPRIAIYMMPGEGRDGTLEHLLWEAAISTQPKFEKCVYNFFDCVGRVKTTSNKHAKMRLSALVGATCMDNPWATAALIWSDKGNPVPVDSECFGSLVAFLKQFAAE